MLNYLKRLFDWISRPWPLHLLPIFVSVHILGIAVFSENIAAWNLFSSTFLQIFGGWFVIKTINDNLGILSRSSILQSLRDYLRSFPVYKPKTMTVQLNGAMMSSGALSMRAIVGDKPKTIQEKLDHLQKEIERLKRENEEFRTEVLGKIEGLKTSLEDAIKDQKMDIHRIESNIVSTLVGGAKEEVLGILCIFYSLFIPYVTLLVT